MRLALEIVEISRANLPTHKPLFIRISATDWHAAGEKDEKTGEWISWGVEQSAVLLQEAIKRGVDMIDVSSGGNDAKQQIKIGPGYQVGLPFCFCGSWAGASADLGFSRQGPVRGTTSRVPQARGSHPHLQCRPHHVWETSRGDPSSRKG